LADLLRHGFKQDWNAINAQLKYAIELKPDNCSWLVLSPVDKIGREL